MTHALINVTFVHEDNIRLYQLAFSVKQIKGHQIQITKGTFITQQIMCHILVNI